MNSLARLLCCITIIVVIAITYIILIDTNLKANTTLISYDIDSISSFDDDILQVNTAAGIEIPDSLIIDEINDCRASVYTNLTEWKNEIYNDEHSFKTWDLKNDQNIIYVVIGLINTEPDNAVNQLTLSLVSYDCLVASTLLGCFKASNASQSNYNRWVCSFSFNDLQAGLYNVSIRGNVCIDNDQNRMWAMASLGLRQGLRFEILTHHLYQIRVSYHITFDTQLLAVNPSCNFSHEVVMKEHGNARWRKKQILEEESIRKYWYNDTYIWGNNICNYRDIRPRDFVLNLKRKNIKSVTLIGDSLTRHMMNELEDYFRYVTSEWLEKHPLHYTDRETMGEWSNWDGIKGGWLRNNGFECAHPYTTGLCYENGILNESPKCNNTDGPLFFYKEFFAIKPYNVLDDWSLKQWTDLIEKDFFENAKENSVIVFNVGLWLFVKYGDPIKESIKIVTAFANLSEKYKVIFIWRSILYNHVQPYNVKIRKMNSDARKILAGRSNMFFLDSSFDMSSLRPDRTSDGFHYGYRKRTSGWRYCDTEEEVFHGAFLNCIREPNWPASVSRAITLMLINYLANTRFEMM